MVYIKARELADSLGGYMSPEDAYEKAMQFAMMGLGDMGKTERARASGGGGGGGLPAPSGGGAGIADSLSNKNIKDDVVGYIERWEKTRGIPKLNEALNGADRILSMEQEALRDPASHGSMVTLNALKEQVRGVASDADMARFYDTSALEQLQQEISYLFKSGRVTREAVARIFKQFRLQHQAAMAKRAQLAEEAAAAAGDFVTFRGGDVTPQTASEWARRRVQQAGGRPAAASGGGAPPAKRAAIEAAKQKYGL
jgi:hypothetical protein